MTLVRSLRRLEITVKGIARALYIGVPFYFLRGGLPLLLVMENKLGMIQCGKEKTKVEVTNAGTVRLCQSSLEYTQAAMATQDLELDFMPEPGWARNAKSF